MLTDTQKAEFWREGYIVLEGGVTPAQLSSLRDIVSDWVERSRAHTRDFGETLDGRARFDLEPDHSAASPALRRVQSPEEISEEFAGAMRNAPMVDMVAELIGPAIKFHHGKVNSKLPGAATAVKFHQDFTFQPMTNDDMVTALVFLDDVTNDNGPLEVVPGTHRGTLYSLWQGGRFTGAVTDAVAAEHRDQAVRCIGPAGAVCLMHCRLLHGSAPNVSTGPRRLYIATYYAEDAVELSPNALPSTLTHELIRGPATGRVRCTPYEMEIPEVPKDTSFFAQQALTKAQ